MRDLRCLILGDDFTPAATFEEALCDRLGPDGRALSFVSVDIEASELTAVQSDEIAEAFGDVAEVARLAADCHLLVTTFAPVTSVTVAVIPGRSARSALSTAITTS